MPKVLETSRGVGVRSVRSSLGDAMPQNSAESAKNILKTYGSIKYERIVIIYKIFYLTLKVSTFFLIKII